MIKILLSLKSVFDDRFAKLVTIKSAGIEANSWDTRVDDEFALVSSNTFRFVVNDKLPPYRTQIFDIVKELIDKIRIELSITDKSSGVEIIYYTDGYKLTDDEINSLGDELAFNSVPTSFLVAELKDLDINQYDFVITYDGLNELETFVQNGGSAINTNMIVPAKMGTDLEMYRDFKLSLRQIIDITFVPIKYFSKGST